MGTVNVCLALKKTPEELADSDSWWMDLIGYCDSVLAEKKPI